MDHNGTVGEVDVVEYVDHPLPLDEGGGAYGLKDVLVVEELRRQSGLPFCRISELRRFHRKTVILPVLGHHDYRFEKQCLTTLSLSISGTLLTVFRNTEPTVSNGNRPGHDQIPCIVFICQLPLSILERKNLPVDQPAASEPLTSRMYGIITY
jgi:hypothetical protein